MVDENMQDSARPRTSRAATVVVVLAVLYAIGLIVQHFSAPPAVFPDRVVLALKDLDGVIFVNDSAENLDNCTVTIDGGFTATIRALPAHQRARVERTQFSGGTARDEWYPRVLRGLAMQCLTPENQTVDVRIK